jgi:hypothetical protein
MPLLETRFDIVHCLGVLHYFPAAFYRSAVEKLMAAAKQILILEMKLIPGPGIGLKTIGIQTLTTHEWLESILSVGGFEVKFKFPVVGDKRQLWICEKTK